MRFYRTSSLTFLATCAATLLFAAPARAQQIPTDSTYEFEVVAENEGIVSNRDGAARSARFLLPAAIAVDGAGNLYVADSQNHTVRRISSNGTVTTLAGRAGEPGFVDGTGSSARFNTPSGIAVNANGIVYVADTYNHSIRRITSAGVVTTLAGSGTPGSADGTAGSVGFRLPTAVALDRSGQLYVADTGNNTVRVVSGSGPVTTLAGEAGRFGLENGTGRAALFMEPRGLAVDASGNVYVADAGSGSIRRISPQGVVTTFAGQPGDARVVNGAASVARFGRPSSLALGSGGRLYVTDGSVVRRIAANGGVDTVAGSATVAGAADGTGTDARFSSATGLAVSETDEIYVADTFNNTVRRITTAGIVSTLAGDSDEVRWSGSSAVLRFSGLRSIVVDAAGNTYVADEFGHTIRRISPAGLVTTLAGSFGLAGSADGSGTSARFSSPSGLALGRNGEVYVADSGNHTIRRVTSAGTVTTIAGSAGEPGSGDGTGMFARFNQPAGIAVDANGTLLVTDRLSHTIRRITTSGSVVTLAGLADTAGSSDGASAQARFFYPRDVVVGSSGTVYVLDGSGTLRRVSSTGTVTTLAGVSGATGFVDGTGQSVRFTNPGGLGIVGDTVFVADTGNGAVRSISADGVSETVTAEGEDLVAPADVAVGTDGTLHVIDSVQNRVLSGTPEVVGIPSIRFQPISQQAVAGGTVVFTVKAESASGYQWYKGGQPIADATDSVLTLENVTAVNAGEYSVRVTGAGGNVDSRTVTLTLVPDVTSRLVNISTRAFAGIGSDVLIAGFVIQGTEPKPVLIRASGPALSDLGVSPVLSDPHLEVHGSQGMLTENDDWSADAATGEQIRLAAQAAGAFQWPAGSKDAAVLLTLEPGPYTAVINGKGGTGGALAEVYELDPANQTTKLINISTRSLVGTGSNVQIAGFVIIGQGPKKVVVRASGPALTKYGVGGVLDDPVLEVVSGTVPIAGNDDWGTELRTEFQKVGIDNWETGSTDAALVLTLPPGSYTAIVRGKEDATGVGLIEVFESP